jgi:hypothetical protein
MGPKVCCHNLTPGMGRVRWTYERGCCRIENAGQWNTYHNPGKGTTSQIVLTGVSIMNLKFGVRKIIKVNASGTNGLNLPRLWFTVTGLKAGDSVSIEMLDNKSLLICPHRGGPDAKAIQ